MTRLWFGAATVLVAAAATPQEEEALEAWERVRANRPTHVKVLYNMEYDKGGSENTFEFKRNGENMSFLECRSDTYEDETKDSMVCWVVNEYYAFIVCRASEDAQWMLNRFRKAGTKEYEDLVERLTLYESNTNFPGITVEDAALWEIVRNTECDFVTDSTGCSLAFHRKSEEPFATETGLKFMPKKGTIVLDREHDWRVDSAQVVDSQGGSRTIHFTYDEKGIPLKTVLQSDGYNVEKQFAEYDFNMRISNADFRLTAFGLPEPEGVPSHKPKTLWIVGVSAVLILFAGAWLLRRRS